MPFSGQPLPGPLPIIGLVGHYPTNYLIGRQLILGPYVSGEAPSSLDSLSGFNLSFPRVSRILGHIIDVLLSSLPVSLRTPGLAWLIRILLAAASRRINGNYWTVALNVIVRIERQYLPHTQLVS